MDETYRLANRGSEYSVYGKPGSSEQCEVGFNNGIEHRSIEALERAAIEVRIARGRVATPIG